VPERPLRGLDVAVNWCIGKYERRGGRLKELFLDAEHVDSLAANFSKLRES